MRTGRILLAAALLIPLASAALAAPPSEPAPWAGWQFLMGNWEALAKPGEPTGSFSFTTELQGRVLVRHNRSEQPVKEGTPVIHEDLLVLYQADGRTQGDYWDSEGHVIRYTEEPTADGSVSLVSDAAAGAPRFRLRYRPGEAGHVLGSFEIAPPGQEEFRPYLQWEAKRGQAD